MLSLIRLKAFNEQHTIKYGVNSQIHTIHTGAEWREFRDSIKLIRDRMPMFNHASLHDTHLYHKKNARYSFVESKFKKFRNENY